MAVRIKYQEIESATVALGYNLGGSRNMVNGNDINHCPISIQYAGHQNNITKNNFKNYSRLGIWFERWFGEQFNVLLKSRWVGNYWDTGRVLVQR